jgi:hypothetical protein
MRNRDLIRAMQRALDVTRPELEHVLTCKDCYLFDSDDAGPHFCHAFEIEFRGWVPRERTPEEQEQAQMWMNIYGPAIQQALQRNLTFGQQP